MNNGRRKEIEAIMARVSNLIGAINEVWDEDVYEDIDDISQNEREYFDNMPESLQSSERGQMAEQACEALDEAKEKYEEIKETLLSDLQDVFDALERAKE